MNTRTLLTILQNNNIRIWAEGDKLRYSAPPDILTQELLAELMQRKTEILAFLSFSETEKSHTGHTIVKVVREGPLPLSFAQQRLWFLDRLEPGSSLYNLSLAVRLIGHCDSRVLGQGLNEIVRRHESLRTTFADKDGRLTQKITSVLNLELPIVDLSDLPEAGRNSSISSLINEEALHPFDLVQGPLLRARLYRLTEEEHILLVTAHHIVTDGWSSDVFFRELSVLYEAYAKGEASPLPELTIQYADYAVWQRQWLQGEVLEKQLSYWKKQLEGAPPVLEFPLDRPRPAVQTYKGASESFVFSAELSEGLKALSQVENATLFMTMLAGFNVLLSRYTGSEDIVTGTPIANRTRVELEDLIGFFVNTLVLRTDLSGGPTFLEVLGRVRETAIGAYSHQDLPFEKLVEEMQPRRNLSHAPLFQVMFALQNAPGSFLSLPYMTVERVEVENRTSKFDLILFIINSKEGLRGSINYNTDLFHAETIQRMLGHYEVLLKSIIDDPAIDISELNILTESEEHQLLYEWNDTKREYPGDKCIHELFEEQAEGTPDAVAVVCEGEQLTYKEFNARANRLAHHLRDLGVEQEMLVGICMERSLDLLVGLLGILKAGGAYLPLDPAYPKERLNFMIEDSRISLLLTTEKYKADLPEFKVRMVSLDEVIKSEGRNENPHNAVSPLNLAYVIYTSGSTGQPKGVCIQHQAVISLSMDRAYIQISPGERIAHASNVSFDAATFEIWAGLLNGACLVVINRDKLLLPSDLAAEIRKQGIDVMFLTTALFNQTAFEMPSAFASIRHLLFGGEAVNPECVRKILRHGPPGRLLHVYGPTECTTFTSWHQVFDVPENAVTVPIGSPLSNKRLYVLDRRLRPVPVCVPGELHIGGDGLARGYLNRPQLTSEKFIPDPFSTGPGARLYKTGDLVRYLPDGNIEFLGRLDNQVKLRGYRIECGEIEAVLGQYPDVKESVVAQKELQGDKRLAAYIVLKQDAEATARELRDYLRERLPDFMVPSAFVFLEALPLTSNGKVDRKALSAPEAMQNRCEADDGPNDALELQLAKIWAKVLGISSVGVRDNFFDAGGHSLLAVRLLAEIKKATGRELSIAAFFQSPTIIQMAEILRREGCTVHWKSLAPLQPNGLKKPFFWIYAESTYSYLQKFFGSDQPLYGIMSQLHDGKPEGYEKIVSQYLSEIRMIQPEGPYYIGGYCFGGLLALEIARRLSKAGMEVSFMFLVDPPVACLPATHWVRMPEAEIHADSAPRSFREKIAPLRMWKKRVKKKDQEPDQNDPVQNVIWGRPAPDAETQALLSRSD